MSARFVIGRLGAQGDGVAETEAGPVFVPFTLPGETVIAARHKDRAALLSLVEPSPLRVEPVCRHFGICGACAVQHLDDDAYRAWKRQKVVDAFKSRGIEAPVADLVPCAPASRRRVVLTARRTEAGMLLGYLKALAHEIVDVVENPIARPEIVAALPALRRLCTLICNTPQPFKLTVTYTHSGLDVAASGSGELTAAARQAGTDFTLKAGFARLSVEGEIVVEPKKPVVMYGEVAISPPPGAFIQAVAEAEANMAALVASHLRKARRIADLFSGSGAFALRLAHRAEVHAVESDAAALAALDRGFRFATGLKRVSTERRDLFRRPLTFKELNLFDGVVFDPPRAGAEAQAKQIARSDVPLVAAVSCNPATLARDLGILVEGGYRIRSLTPLDQFLWSPHVEAVALLERPRKRR